MPEHDYDRLEQFFRKAAAKADVSFNEEDWKKLENRLDAETSGQTSISKTGTRGSTTVVIGILLSVSTAIWVSSDYNAERDAAVDMIRTGVNIQPLQESGETPGMSAVPADPDISASQQEESGQELAKAGEVEEQQLPSLQNTNVAAVEREGLNQQAASREELAETPPIASAELGGSDPAQGDYSETSSETRNKLKPESSEKRVPEKKEQADDLIIEERLSAGDLDEIALSLPATGNQVMHHPPDTSERNKQKAVVELPGAEEEETREAQAMVQKEHASDKKKHVATPRLSLLLSFAPDFSGTSMGLSSAPGKAFGAMLHYHPFERWSISAGAVKNHKQYSGSGEDYKPPKGYWKNYTNGVIPETIDGSCDILEFPLMIQYTAIQNGRSRWNVAAGASSYLMQSESYRYNFDQPNPGARGGWDSKGSSRFIFNMLIFTVGYERQVLPGLMVGIEPYAKIPLEEIGWSNLKLFSSGASFTLRYTILRRNSLLVPTRSRGPD